jgi:hypothetical protein
MHRHAEAAVAVQPVRELRVSDTLRQLVPDYEPSANLQQMWCDVGFCFSLGRDGGHPLGACPTDELPADATDAQLAERVETHGGFSVPVHLRRTGQQS